MLSLFFTPFHISYFLSQTFLKCRLIFCERKKHLNYLYVYIADVIFVLISVILRRNKFELENLLKKMHTYSGAGIVNGPILNNYVRMSLIAVINLAHNM